jgi:hypothetical protein
MQRLIKIGEGILLGGLVMLLFLVVFESRIHVPNWLMVVGRMHPLFLHFPIVLLLISLLLFWLPIKEQHTELLTILRLTAALSATLTAIMGLLLSLETTTDGSILQWHKWGGISIAVLGSVLYAFYARLVTAKKTGKVFTIGVAMIIIFTGHFGGDITHGNNYLLEPLQSKEVKHTPFDQAMVFDDIIKPIFTAKCASCHGNGSVKGGLLLVDSTGIIKGGKTGPLYIAGDPAASLLLTRIHLPDDDKKHMPPRIKSPLSEEEIALLTAWIRSGALLNYKVAMLPVKDSFRLLAAANLAPAIVNSNPVYDFPAADEKKIKELSNNYRVLEQLGMGSPALSVYFYGKAAYTKKSLEELAAVKKQVVTLSLARMPVKDEELAIVNQFSNLEKLNLNYTDITAKGLAQLNGLQKLQELSLSGTAVTAEAIEKIASLPKINSIVIWDTKIDTLQVASLQKKYKKVKIENGFVDNGKFVAVLSPPMILSSGGVFDTMRIIKMKHPFHGVSIRYTLDGKLPDSINSLLYKDSFAIEASTQLKVRAFRQGWTGSGPVEALYLKRGFIPDSVELVTPPDPKYKGVGKILTDKDLSDLNFGNGKWLGYMNNPAEINLYFNNKVKIHSVLVNLLQRNGSSIFLPTKLEIWGGGDKMHLNLLGRIDSPVPEKNQPDSLIQKTISFAATSLKMIKIVAQPVKSLPKWHRAKGKKGWVFLNEVVVN